MPSQFILISSNSKATTQLQNLGCSFFIIEYKRGAVFNSLPEFIINSGQSLQWIIWVFPNEWKQKRNLEYWPKCIESAQNKYFINSILFEDQIHDLILEIQLDKHNQTNCPPVYFTSSYSKNYTDTLDLWQSKGAIGLHPGDYYHEELMQKIKQLSGIWIHFGHANSKNIFLNNTINFPTLEKSMPPKPLSICIWCCCESLKGGCNSIALKWYLNNGTQCILASTQQIDTINNERFLQLLLKDVINNKNQNLIKRLHSLLKSDSKFIFEHLQQFHLLGIPDAKIEL